MWLQSPVLSFTHGFTTRHGGVSNGKFYSLNLAGSEDDPLHVQQNRERSLGALNLTPEHLCLLKQIHSADVCEAKPGYQTGDALVSKNPDHILAVSVADCYPILFCDEKNKVMGAAHAGWRGSLAGIAGRTVEKMIAMGAVASQIKVAIGQGISAAHFEVGNEVSSQFSKAGFPYSILQGNRIDLVSANLFILLNSGIKKENIWSMNRCTFESDFFSYRRDKGVTGRMWGLMTLRSAAKKT